MTNTTQPTPVQRSQTTMSARVADSNSAAPIPTDLYDIEHIPVEDDPRQWSNFRKNFVLLLVAFGSMIAGLSANIQNRDNLRNASVASIAQMKEDLNATSSQISLTIALFILLQGALPLVWSSISEFKGRKMVYITSIGMYTAGSIVVSVSKTIGLVIGFRCAQAIGSSAVMAIGAATLADIFEPEERGTKMGIYYMAPLLGPSMGAILGGALTQGFGWRGPFYFLSITGGLVCLSFLFFFKDTYRRERSLVYQNAVQHHLREESRKIAKHSAEASTEEKRTTAKDANVDVEKQNQRRKDAFANVEISFSDISPFKPLWTVLRRLNNFCVLLASGLLFAFCFVIPYLMSRTLSIYYHYDALKIGLVLLSFGIGNMVGSVLGGRWSDYQLAKFKAENGGKGEPEMRLKSTIHGIVLFPLFTLGYAWIVDRHLHIAAIVVMLFSCGFVVIFVYTSTLAYIVDSNVGRSSTAVALNSAFRGTAAFIMTEIAVPMQDGLGDGWTYTIFTVLMVISGMLLVLTAYKGGQWRVSAMERERVSAEKP